MDLISLPFIMALLVAFQVKHLLADYVLQTRWMTEGKAGSGLAFVKPLLAHASIHAAMTAVIILFVAPAMVWLAVIDLAAHGVLDRIKASPHLLGRYGETAERPFWLAFGADQFGHHMTHYLIIWILMVHGSPS